MHFKDTWARHVALLLGGVVVAAGIGALSPTREGFLRGMGGILQLLGLAVAVTTIKNVRRDFGLPSIWTEMRSELTTLGRLMWTRLRVLFRPSKRSVNIAALTLRAVVPRIDLRAQQVGTPQLPMEARIAQLEEHVSKLQISHWQLQDTMSREVSEIKQAFEAERDTRAERERVIETTMTSLAVGGLRMEVVASVWFLLGTVLTTWSPELSRLRLP